MKMGPEHHVNDVQMISDDCIAGGFVEVQGVFYEIRHVTAEGFTQSEVNEEIRHPEVMHDDLLKTNARVRSRDLQYSFSVRQKVE